MQFPKNAIRRRVAVQDEDKSRTFSGELARAPIGGGGGTLFFIGMPGAGRRELARAAALDLGLDYVEAGTRQSLEAALAAPGQGASGKAVAVTGADLDDWTVKLMRESGKVFYIMTVAPILAKRLGDLSRLDGLIAEVERLEPLFMRAAHFVMPLAATPEEMLEDVREKARL